MGSNLEVPLAQLRRAVGGLAALGEDCVVSSLYATRPVGGPPQDDYLNAALRFRYRRPLPSLLCELQKLEARAGRRRPVRWGPRTLDLDVLWVAGVARQLPELEVPHPRLPLRAFALQPLLDVAPDARDPTTGIAYREHLRRLGRAGVVETSAGSVWAQAADVTRRIRPELSASRERALDRLGP